MIEKCGFYVIQDPYLKLKNSKIKNLLILHWCSLYFQVFWNNLVSLATLYDCTGEAVALPTTLSLTFAAVLVAAVALAKC